MDLACDLNQRDSCLSTFVISNLNALDQQSPDFYESAARMDKMKKHRDDSESVTAEPPSPINQFLSFLHATEPLYDELVSLRKKVRSETEIVPRQLRSNKGWSNPKGDEHFQNQRQRADEYTPAAAMRFYVMMQQIGDEMQKKTSAFSTDRLPSHVRILDLCMAPGGYTYTALSNNTDAVAYGITLPPEKGGYNVMLNHPRSSVLYTDITMFAREFGVEEVPSTHPEHAAFSLERPFLDTKFDMIICDGQVLRTHERPGYRQDTEASRLTSSQLVFALQRIRPGGTLIMLMHKIEKFGTMDLLYTFSKIARIEVFKPVKKHATRSTFYLIAKNVQPDTEAGKAAVLAWKTAWWTATFGGDGTGERGVSFSDNYAQQVIDAFGKEFVALARPVWSIQKDALRRSDFAR